MKKIVTFLFFFLCSLMIQVSVIAQVDEKALIESLVKTRNLEFKFVKTKKTAKARIHYEYDLFESYVTCGAGPSEYTVNYSWRLTEPITVFDVCSNSSEDELMLYAWEHDSLYQKYVCSDYIQVFESTEFSEMYDWLYYEFWTGDTSIVSSLLECGYSLVIDKNIGYYPLQQRNFDKIVINLHEVDTTYSVSKVAYSTIKRSRMDLCGGADGPVLDEESDLPDMLMWSYNDTYDRILSEKAPESVFTTREINSLLMWLEKDLARK